MQPEAGAENGERIWDPLVRLTHWTIALAVVLNGFFIDDDALAHIWIGYVALALLALRLVWGLIGPENARFSAFPPSLPAAARHLSDLLHGKHRRHRSHNPLGGLMVYALWTMLAVVSLTGLMLGSAPFPQETERYVQTAQFEDDARYENEDNEVIEEIHAAAANLLLLLAALHVAGVFIESRLSGENLLRPMISGRNPRPRP